MIMTTVKKSEDEWKKILSPKQYHVLREKGTELPFTGEYLRNNKKGMYICAACSNELFSSDTKFESLCGWPSFYDAIDSKKIKLHEDVSFGMKRTEVMCGRCGSHLGHVFDDGPKPTGKRFCINSVSLKFKEAKPKDEKRKNR
jgi:peptide-methionine (R)-S-oxide reductase